MAQERKGGLGRGLAALIPSSTESADKTGKTGRLGDGAADVSLGGHLGVNLEDVTTKASLADALEIYRLAAETRTPCFSTSGLRFTAEGGRDRRGRVKVRTVLIELPNTLDEYQAQD